MVQSHPAQVRRFIRDLQEVNELLPADACLAAGRGGLLVTLPCVSMFTCVNWPGEPHTVLRLHPQSLLCLLHGARLEKEICCCYCWYRYWSQQAGVRSPIAAFYCPSQGSWPWSRFLPAQPKPPCAHGSGAAGRLDPARPARSRPTALRHTLPGRPAQGDAPRCLHGGRPEGLEGQPQLSRSRRCRPGRKHRGGNILHMDAGCMQRSALNIGRWTTPTPHPPTFGKFIF